MNLKSTKFTVDRCTPRDRFATRFTRVAQISFPTSVRKSIDDSCIDFPLSPFYSPIEESFIRPRATSDAFRGHTYSPSIVTNILIPHVHRHRSISSTRRVRLRPLQRLLRTYFTQTSRKAPLTQESSSPIFADPVPVTPGPAGLEPSHPIWIFDSSLREVDFDVTCLGALDEQLLYAPKESAGAAAQPEEKPWMWQPQTERETDSEESDQRALIPSSCKWSSFFPSPESYTPRSPQRMMFAESESRMLYQNANHSVHFFPVPQQRKQTTQDPPDTPSGKLKLFSDAYGTLTGRRRTTSN
ncbi:hypothetical protein DFJ58DRAFT_845560 [Suillus subalutaceus]|uniref:uncharacterized protein n=1 Tax=Suillus subalutaceus TaxID=48586 RepID=UPI001B87AF2A|nr:uncharacterized protein DFJ58DRAFT_845560 [Suillus subalutaceus]KAG1839920.1 hypothetical protein DFJ58DRAFT_845560 [Suillus subalutaceus]